MRYLVVLESDTLFHLWGDGPFRRLNPLFLVGSRSLRNKLTNRGHKVRCSDITDVKLYERLKVSSADTLIVHISGKTLRKKVVKSIRAAAPDASLLVLSDDEAAPPLHSSPTLRQVALSGLCGDALDTAVRDLHNQLRVSRIKDILGDADKVFILMQHDPDPDAIASGLALRALLGRNRATAPLTSMGRVERPENLAMLKLLEIEVGPFTEEYLEGNSKMAMVDVQPPYFKGRFPGADVVIDHHPQTEKYEAGYQDIRTRYGATATILTEYLKAEDIHITHRLATALLYGIKSDTLLLDRETDRADVEAYTYLYPLVNHNLVRRMERPELPVEGLDPFADALKNRIVNNGVFFSHMQDCAREDLIPQFAEFCLQVEGVEWSVVSGLVEDNLVVSVRNVGYIKSAGEVVREAFGKLGSAGGHRAMAKAVMPLENLDHEIDTRDKLKIRDFIAHKFLAALHLEETR